MRARFFVRMCSCEASHAFVCVRVRVCARALFVCTCLSEDARAFVCTRVCGRARFYNCARAICACAFFRGHPFVCARAFLCGRTLVCLWAQARARTSLYAFLCGHVRAHAHAPTKHHKKLQNVRVLFYSICIFHVIYFHHYKIQFTAMKNSPATATTLTSKVNKVNLCFTNHGGSTTSSCCFLGRLFLPRCFLSYNSSSS